MAVTANETSRVAFGMDDRTTLQVPVPPASLVEHWPTSELDPFQLPLTVTPFSRLCLTSCAVIRTVADHVPVFPLVSATPSRLPTWTLGGSTVTTIARALLLELTSASFCVAVRMCPLVATPAVFQLKVRVALAPAEVQLKDRVAVATTASAVTVWVPIVTPAVASVKTTLKVVLTFSPPTFWTVTQMAAVLP